MRGTTELGGHGCFLVCGLLPRASLGCQAEDLRAIHRSLSLIVQRTFFHLSKVSFSSLVNGTNLCFYALIEPVRVDMD